MRTPFDGLYWTQEVIRYGKAPNALAASALMALGYNANMDGACTLEFDELQKNTAMSAEELDQALDDLEKAGLIKREGYVNPVGRPGILLLITRDKNGEIVFEENPKNGN